MIRYCIEIRRLFLVFASFLSCMKLPISSNDTKYMAKLFKVRLVASSPQILTNYCHVGLEEVDRLAKEWFAMLFHHLVL